LLQLPSEQQVPPQQTLPKLQHSPLQHWEGAQQVPSPQSMRPGSHLQVPFWQVLPPVHLLPQAPQLFGSVAGLMQVPPQHNRPVSQARPQPPQSVSAEEKSVHRPLQQSCPGQQGSVYVVTVQSSPPPSQSGICWQHSVVQSWVQSGLHGPRVVVHLKLAGPRVARKAQLAVTRWVGSMLRKTTVSLSARGRVCIGADLRSQPDGAGFVQS
jgi:hypothetical protein